MLAARRGCRGRSIIFSNPEIAASARTRGSAARTCARRASASSLATKSSGFQPRDRPAGSNRESATSAVSRFILPLLSRRRSRSTREPVRRAGPVDALERVAAMHVRRAPAPAFRRSCACAPRLKPFGKPIPGLRRRQQAGARAQYVLIVRRQSLGQPAAAIAEIRMHEVTEFVHRGPVVGEFRGGRLGSTSSSQRIALAARSTGRNARTRTSRPVAADRNHQHLHIGQRQPPVGAEYGLRNAIEPRAQLRALVCARRHAG